VIGIRPSALDPFGGLADRRLSEGEIGGHAALWNEQRIAREESP
jgi:hypothetical protein